MSIVRLVRITLYGSQSQAPHVLRRLQELGCVHLVPMSDADSEVVVPSADDEDARTALQELKSCSRPLRPSARVDEFDRKQIVAETLELQRERAALREERDELRQAIADLRPWGEFQMPAGGRIGDVALRFHRVRHRDMDELIAAVPSWTIVNRDPEYVYVVTLNAASPPSIPGTEIQLDPRPLSELKSRLEWVHERLEELEYRRIGLSRWRKLLAQQLDEADDAAARDRAERLLKRHGSVFALRGWAPRDAADPLRRFSDEQGLAMQLEPPGEDDEPPTLLSLPAGWAGSQNLVTFYKTPRYDAWDPSLISFLSFAVFFAMIVADAGYGLVLAVLVGFFWKKMGSSRIGRQQRNLLAVIVLATIVYGTLAGSYFGIAPPADSIGDRLRVLDPQSQSQMMPLTIAIGVIHLCLAHLVTAWQNRGRGTALASLGWIVVMAGATLAGAARMNWLNDEIVDRSLQMGGWMIGGGLLAVFLFSSPRPVMPPNLRNWAGRVLDGFQGLTGLSGLFGDALSYLRLFALGLASAKLSETFNRLGASAWDQAGFGVIAALGILLLGHTLNLGLSIMSGVVHGLRLNCIEFYKWSLPEEGYSFNAFAKKAKQP